MDIYKDISARTGGDIYIGVVGAVRTGKSTFIRRFMEMLVMPVITDENDKARISDELPQSGSGRSIMTTQPHFVPNEAVRVPIGDSGIEPSLRMIDCVGYMIDGITDADEVRMVHTPWSDTEMPFEQAAETGTQRVIEEHSTIAILVTTDGTATGIERSAYESAEAAVAKRLINSGKPFITVVNSTEPRSDAAIALASELEERYGARAVAMDVMNMQEADCEKLIEDMLMEFPIRTITFETPAWVCALGAEHELCKSIRTAIMSSLDGVSRMKDVERIPDMPAIDRFSAPLLREIDCGTGSAAFSIQPDEKLFYEILSEECGFTIEDDRHLITALRDFAVAKEAYDRLKGALDEADRTGYGLVPPSMDEMTLEKPEIVRQGSRFGVKLRANAQGLHLIKVNVDSEIAPLVGTEEQSAELVEYLLDTIKNAPDDIWQTNIFGKSLYDLITNGMMGKVNSLPDEVRQKLREAVQRIVNEECRNLICVML